MFSSGKNDLYIYMFFFVILFIVQGCISENEEIPVIKLDGKFHKNIEATIFSFAVSKEDKNGISAYNDIDPLKTENPFYVALPFNNRLFSESSIRSKLIKNRWVEIVNISNGIIGYGQVEDVGPWFVIDKDYLFNEEVRPFSEYAYKKTYDIYMVPNKTRVIKNRAGIDLSPELAKFLKITGKSKVHWRFVDVKNVDKGPWLDKISILPPKFKKNSPKLLFINRRNKNLL